MAVNQSRSMTAELAEGRTDGSVNKVAQNRSGDVEVATRLARQSLFPEFYGNPSQDAGVHYHGDEMIPR